MKPLNAISGSKTIDIEAYNALRVDVDDIVPDFDTMARTSGGALTQEAYEACQRILSVRREVMVREANLEIEAGRKLRYEAEVEECSERLKNEPDLPRHRKKDLQGRMVEAMGRVHLSDETVKQLKFELIVLYQGLER